MALAPIDAAEMRWTLYTYTVQPPPPPPAVDAWADTGEKIAGSTIAAAMGAARRLFMMPGLVLCNTS
jgi:hypothetical protein